MPTPLFTSVCWAALAGVESGMKVGTGVRACRMTGSTISVPCSADRSGIRVPASKS